MSSLCSEVRLLPWRLQPREKEKRREMMPFSRDHPSLDQLSPGQRTARNPQIKDLLVYSPFRSPWYHPSPMHSSELGRSPRGEAGDPLGVSIVQEVTCGFRDFPKLPKLQEILVVGSRSQEFWPFSESSRSFPLWRQWHFLSNFLCL